MRVKNHQMRAVIKKGDWIEKIIQEVRARMTQEEERREAMMMADQSMEELVSMEMKEKEKGEDQPKRQMKRMRQRSNKRMLCMMGCGCVGGQRVQRE